MKIAKLKKEEEKNFIAMSINFMIKDIVKETEKAIALEDRIYIGVGKVDSRMIWLPKKLVRTDEKGRILVINWLYSQKELYKK